MRMKMKIVNCSNLMTLGFIINDGAMLKLLGEPIDKEAQKWSGVLGKDMFVIYFLGRFSFKIYGHTMRVFWNFKKLLKQDPQLFSPFERE